MKNRFKQLSWEFQIELLLITDAPYSSYCSRVIHIFWNEGNEAKIEPPIHTENLRSGCAAILISLVAGTSLTSSLSSRFLMPEVVNLALDF